MATRVMVNIPGEIPYAVRIGAGILDQLGDDLRSVEALSGRNDVLVISDSNVAPLYGAQAKRSLEQSGYRVAEATIEAGESSKSLAVAGELWSALAQLSYGRDCFIVALGGGVVGDLAGYVASCYMRGVPFVQVPTTLLAMVDSSVGGKCAVNLPEGKNLVGTFHQPVFVCADTDTLASLPEREWLCGCAEVAKSAAIDSDDFFFWLSESSAAVAERESTAVAEAIERCVVFKAGVVARDKTESAGIRECLNFGHTLGHAIESVAGYGVFSHGAAVAEGMRFALDLVQDGSPDAAAFQTAMGDLLDELGLTATDWSAPADELLDAMKHDKKNRKGEIRFVLANDIGHWHVAAIEEPRLLAALQDWSARSTSRS